MSKCGRPCAGSNELILTRALTTCPKKAVGSEVAKWHSLRRCAHGAVLDICKRFITNHAGSALRFITSGSCFLANTLEVCVQRTPQGGKGCTWRISVELSFRTSNEIQPLVEAHVLKEVRKDYTLSVDLTSEWMASHQGKDFASRCCHGDGCLGCLAKLLPCSMKKRLMKTNWPTVTPWSFGRSLGMPKPEEA